MFVNYAASVFGVPIRSAASWCYIVSRKATEHLHSRRCKCLLAMGLKAFNSLNSQYIFICDVEAQIKLITGAIRLVDVHKELK